MIDNKIVSFDGKTQEAIYKALQHATDEELRAIHFNGWNLEFQYIGSDCMRMAERILKERGINPRQKPTQSKEKNRNEKQ